MSLLSVVAYVKLWSSATPCNAHTTQNGSWLAFCHVHTGTPFNGSMEEYAGPVSHVVLKLVLFPTYGYGDRLLPDCFYHFHMFAPVLSLGKLLKKSFPSHIQVNSCHLEKPKLTIHLQLIHDYLLNLRSSVYPMHTWWIMECNYSLTGIQVWSVVTDHCVLKLCSRSHIIASNHSQ